MCNLSTVFGCITVEKARQGRDGAGGPWTWLRLQFPQSADQTRICMAPRESRKVCLIFRDWVAISRVQYIHVGRRAFTLSTVTRFASLRLGAATDLNIYPFKLWSVYERSSHANFGGGQSDLNGAIDRQDWKTRLPLTCEKGVCRIAEARRLARRCMAGRLPQTAQKPIMLRDCRYTREKSGLQIALCCRTLMHCRSLVGPAQMIEHFA